MDGHTNKRTLSHEHMPRKLPKLENESRQNAAVAAKAASEIIRNLLTTMSRTFDGWTTEMTLAMDAYPGILRASDREFLCMLQQDFMDIAFSSFKKRVTNALDHADAVGQSPSGNEEEEPRTKALEGLHALQNYFIAGSNRSTTDRSQTAAPPLDNGDGKIPGFDQDKTGGSQAPLPSKPASMGRPSVGDVPARSAEEAANSFLESMEQTLPGLGVSAQTPQHQQAQEQQAQEQQPQEQQSQAHGASNAGCSSNLMGFGFPPSPFQFHPGAMLPDAVNPFQYGYSAQNTGSSTQASHEDTSTGLSPAGKPTQLQLRPSGRQSETKPVHRSPTPTRPSKRASIRSSPGRRQPLVSPHTFSNVCPEDLLSRPCPRNSRAHFMYPCDCQKICNYGTGCRDKNCKNVHIKRTCKAYVHNGNCDDRRCKLGHDFVIERRMAADRSRTHVGGGSKFVPPMGQQRSRKPGGGSSWVDSHGPGDYYESRRLLRYSPSL